MILIEIQDTLKQPPSEEKAMKKATHIGIFVTVRAPHIQKILWPLMDVLRPIVVSFDGLQLLVCMVMFCLISQLCAQQ